MQSSQQFPKILSFADLAAEVPLYGGPRYPNIGTLNSEFAPIQQNSFYSTPSEQQIMPQIARNVNFHQVPQQFMVSVFNKSF